MSKKAKAFEEISITEEDLKKLNIDKIREDMKNTQTKLNVLQENKVKHNQFATGAFTQKDTVQNSNLYCKLENKNAYVYIDTSLGNKIITANRYVQAGTVKLYTSKPIGYKLNRECLNAYSNIEKLENQLSAIPFLIESTRLEVPKTNNEMKEAFEKQDKAFNEHEENMRLFSELNEEERFEVMMSLFENDYFNKCMNWYGKDNDDVIVVLQVFFVEDNDGKLVDVCYFKYMTRREYNKQDLKIDKRGNIFIDFTGIVFDYISDKEEFSQWEDSYRLVIGENVHRVFHRVDYETANTGFNYIAWDSLDEIVNPDIFDYDYSLAVNRWGEPSKDEYIY